MTVMQSSGDDLGGVTQLISRLSADDLQNMTSVSNMTGMIDEQVDESVKLTFYSIVYICIGTLGVSGNLFVALVMLSSRDLRGKITNIFIIDQSFVDATAAAALLGHSTSQYYSGGYVGIWGLLKCKLWTNKWFMWHMFVVSTYNLVFLTFERYVHIIYPFKYQAFFNKKIVGLMIFTAWMFPFSYKSPLFIHTTTVKNGFCSVMTEWQHPGWQQFWGILTALLQYFVPLFAMVICYSRMIALIRRKPFGAGQEETKDKEKSKRDEKMARASRNILKTLILVCAAFATCWCNNQVYFLMFNLGYPVDFNGTYFHFTVIMVFLNCCINPFIYALSFHPFQKQVMYLFCRCCRKETPGSVRGSTATVNTTG